MDVEFEYIEWKLLLWHLLRFITEIPSVMVQTFRLLNVHMVSFCYSVRFVEVKGVAALWGDSYLFVWGGFLSPQHQVKLERLFYKSASINIGLNSTGKNERIFTLTRWKRGFLMWKLCIYVYWLVLPVVPDWLWSPNLMDAWIYILPRGRNICDWLVKVNFRLAMYD